MNVSNLSKIEIRNTSINSSCKSISRFEEQKDMIQLLDNQLNVKLINFYNFFYLQNKRASSHIKNNSEKNESDSFRIKEKLSFKNLNSLRKKSSFFPNDIDKNESELEKNEEIKNNSIKESKGNFDRCQKYEKKRSDQISLSKQTNKDGEDTNNMIDYRQNKEKSNKEFKGFNLYNNENNNNQIMNNNMNNVIQNYLLDSNNIKNNLEINQNNNITDNINQSSNDTNLCKINSSNSSKTINRTPILNHIYNNTNMNMNAYNTNYSNFDISKLSIMKHKNNSFKFPNIYNQNYLNMPLPLIINSINDKDLFDNCTNLCKEQLECRILQKKLDDNPSLASDFVYNKIKDKFYELSLDQFGNYFIQKVIEYLNIEHIKEILYKKIPTHFRCLCFNQHGTRVIQKLFERIVNNEELLNFYIVLLTPNLKDFIIEQNANHIIIKYINMVPNTKINFILKFIIDNILELSTKKHSCCVLQKCIELSDQEQKKELLKAIAFQSFKLIDDQFGNYVIQYCLNVCDYEINKIIANNFLYNLEKFSTEKYSSNVIEKCLDCCDEETKEIIVNRCCEPNLIKKLLFNVYGNYVLQKVIFLSKEPIRSQYINIVGPLIHNLPFYSFGQKLYNKLLASIPELSKFIFMGRCDEKKYKRRKNKTNRINNSKININNNMNNNNINPYNMNINNFSINNINHINNINNNPYIMAQINQNNLNLNQYNNFNKNINNNIMNCQNLNDLNFMSNNNLIDNNIYNQYINNNLYINNYNNNQMFSYNNSLPSMNMDLLRMDI